MRIHSEAFVSSAYLMASTRAVFPELFSPTTTLRFGFRARLNSLKIRKFEMAICEMNMVHGNGAQTSVQMNRIYFALKTVLQSCLVVRGNLERDFEGPHGPGCWRVILP